MVITWPNNDRVGHVGIVFRMRYDFTIIIIIIIIIILILCA
jgi:hypothetical protein